MLSSERQRQSVRPVVCGALSLWPGRKPREDTRQARALPHSYAPACRALRVTKPKTQWGPKRKHLCLLKHRRTEHSGWQTSQDSGQEPRSKKSRQVNTKISGSTPPLWLMARLQKHRSQPRNGSRPGTAGHANNPSCSGSQAGGSKFGASLENQQNCVSAQKIKGAGDVAQG